MMELVDMSVLETDAKQHKSSSLFVGTKKRSNDICELHISFFYTSFLKTKNEAFISLINFYFVDALVDTSFLLSFSLFCVVVSFFLVCCFLLGVLVGPAPDWKVST